MVAELNNTFGERHLELLRGGELAYEHDKHLHVSPFFGLDASYGTPSRSRRSRSSRGSTSARARRDRSTAVLHGRRRELTNRSLARMLLRYPLMPVQVVWLIHWQALRLWLKRVPFHRKPAFVPGQGSVKE